MPASLRAGSPRFTALSAASPCELHARFTGVSPPLVRAMAACLPRFTALTAASPSELHGRYEASPRPPLLDGPWLPPSELTGVSPPLVRAMPACLPYLSERGPPRFTAASSELHALTAASPVELHARSTGVSPPLARAMAACLASRL